jgi:hypothetical protein
MRLATRAAASLAVAAGLFGATATVAANAVDLGSENITVHIDNNHITAPLCVHVFLASRSHGTIIDETICIPAL